MDLDGIDTGNDRSVIISHGDVPTSWIGIYGDSGGLGSDEVNAA